MMTNQNSFWNWKNLLITIGFIGMIVCVTTNLIFLIEWGFFDFEIHKKFTHKVTRIPVLIFFASIGLFYYLKTEEFMKLKSVQYLNEVVSKKNYYLIAVLTLIYIVVLTYGSFLRHWALETRAFDLGIFAQALWNTLQGDWLMSSIKGNISYLGDHASPILLLLTPLYGLWPDPKSLLLLQVVMAALGVIPIVLIAREKTKNPWIVFAFACLYLLYVPTRNALHEDFHPEVLVEPFMLFAFYFLERKKFALFVINLFIVVLAKENMFGIAFMFGFYALLFKQLYKLGIALMVGSVAIFFIEILWLIPSLGDGQYLYSASYDFAEESPVGAILSVLMDGERWEYVMKVFLPFSFLSFFHPPTLILTLPILIQNFISENETMRSFSYHYTTGMTPFVFISSIYGFQIIHEKIIKNEKFRVLLVMLVMAVALMRASPSEYYYLHHSESHRSEHRDMIREELAAIPGDATVLTHNNLIPQTLNRRYIYQFDYTKHYRKAKQAVDVNADYVIIDKDFWEPKTGDLATNLAELNTSGYQVVKEDNGFYMLRKSK